MKSILVGISLCLCSWPALSQDRAAETLSKATMQRAYACSLWASSSLLLHFPDEPYSKIAEAAFDSCPYEWLAYDSAQRQKLGGSEGTSFEATAQVLRDMTIPQLVKIINESKHENSVMTRLKLIEQANRLQQLYESSTQ
ncbi:hypothetical protein ACJKIH_03140 [Brucella pseudogrignonensis]|uniref:hypothetical protein n=1 Tax=Brucella pseudogrignonensis TaxID=419475 RepID=UPI0038B43074